MEPAGGVAEDHVHLLGRAALDRLEADARGVGPLLAAHDRGADALRPDLELLAGGGAEGVARAEQDRVAGRLELRRELADGGGLARSRSRPRP